MNADRHQVAANW